MLLGGATWTTGHQGAGVAFNGSSGVVAVQPADGSPLWNYPTAPMTMMAWIRPDAAAIASTAATAVARTHEDYAFQNFWLGLVTAIRRCTIHNEYGEGPTALAKVAANTWTHVACTYGLDGAILVYVNGSLAATGNTNQVLGPSRRASCSARRARKRRGARLLLGRDRRRPHLEPGAHRRPGRTIAQQPLPWRRRLRTAERARPALRSSRAARRR